MTEKSRRRGEKQGKARAVRAAAANTALITLRWRRFTFYLQKQFYCGGLVKDQSKLPFWI